MKKCVFCRVEISTESLTEISATSGEEICVKCHKNELRYGKPELCKYCQLTAAFVDKKCVHCSYSERKHGPPQLCHNCKLIAAFPKDPSCRIQKLLCRLCKLSYKRGIAKAEISRKRVDEANETYAGQIFKQFKGSSLAESGDTLGDQILVVTQLKDQVSSLQRQMAQKDQAILERDKKIASLNAQNMQLVKEQRMKLQQVQKEHQEAQEVSQEKLKSLTRQVASLSKGNKKHFLSDGTTRSPTVSS